MCTAIGYQGRDFYFGRNLDLECSYGEQVTITPRNLPLPFRCLNTIHTHYAMIGMAHAVGGYPLYFEATNECGLSMAGLNFPKNAYYGDKIPGKDCVSPFELIPWILGQCRNLDQAKERLDRMALVNLPFSEQLPLSPLHWIIADETGAVTVESTREGLQIYHNPMGILTNNPPFPFHLDHLSHFMAATATPPKNHFPQSWCVEGYSRGMGPMGLPGDWSSSSRFVRAAFVKANAPQYESEDAAVGHFFHMLDAVAVPRGCMILENGMDEYTIYSSCCNASQGIYYYKTYDHSRITAVDLHRVNLDGQELIRYPRPEGHDVQKQNY